MYDATIKGVEYTDIIYKDKEFIVQRTKVIRNTKYNNQFRLVNTNGSKDELHTHLNNLGVCKKVIHYTRKKQLLLTARKYLIKSCARVTTDIEYKDKCMDLYNRKRKKQGFHNKNMRSR